MVYPSYMNKRKVSVGIVAFFMVAALLYGSTRNYGGGSVRALLVIENGGLTKYEADIPSGSSVFDLMTALNVPFEEQGGFVTSIKGISQDTGAGKYWVYYINGEYAPVGAADYIVQDGDEITWKLEGF